MKKKLFAFFYLGFPLSGIFRSPQKRLVGHQQVNFANHKQNIV
jgi:hypothetical protein